MTDTPNARTRTGRIEEVVLEVPGVTHVRVWQLEEGIEIGIRVSSSEAVVDVMKQVEEATEALREPDERWSIGLLMES